MTRKDYISIAGALREHYQYALPESQSKTTWRRQYATGFTDSILETAKRIATVMADDNPRFDREHFLAVVRGEKELSSRPARS